MTVVLASGPSVIHLQRSEVTTVPGAVLTYCGKRGMPYPYLPQAWRTCRKCSRAAKDGGQ